MHLKLTPDKKLPQVYLEACVLDKEYAQIEKRIPADIFHGLSSMQVRELGIYAVLKSFPMAAEEDALRKSKKAIILPGGRVLGGDC